jgi:hypothetical protein
MDWSTQFPELLGTLLLVTSNIQFSVINLGFLSKTVTRLGPDPGFRKKIVTNSTVDSKYACFNKKSKLFYSYCETVLDDFQASGEATYPPESIE